MTRSFGQPSTTMDCVMIGAGGVRVEERHVLWLWLSALQVEGGWSGRLPNPIPVENTTPCSHSHLPLSNRELHFHQIKTITPYVYRANCNRKYSSHPFCLQSLTTGTVRWAESILILETRNRRPTFLSKATQGIRGRTRIRIPVLNVMLPRTAC